MSIGNNPEVERVAREQMVRDTMMRKLQTTLDNYGSTMPAEVVYDKMTDDEKENIFGMSGEELQALHNKLIERSVPEAHRSESKEKVA